MTKGRRLAGRCLKPDRDEKFLKLKEDLSEAFRTIIELSPYPLNEQLEKYHECLTRDDVREWISVTVKKVVEFAFICTSDNELSHRLIIAGFRERARCPLCKGTSSAPYCNDGFSLPTGLERHLTGYGTVRECKVMEAARKLALEHIENHRRWEYEKKLREDKEKRRLARLEKKAREAEAARLEAETREKGEDKSEG